MKIAVIQATSRAKKNRMLYEYTEKFAVGHKVVNFGCFEDERETYSYIEISVLIGLLLAERAVDFVVTGCSSGQGMMPACNSMPGVLCGYTPSPADAYLFAQINNGNAVSLPLGEEYTYSGEENLKRTPERLFSEPFGGGYPKEDAMRKLRDTELPKRIRRQSQLSPAAFFAGLDEDLTRKISKKENVLRYIRENAAAPGGFFPAVDESRMPWYNMREK